MIKKSWKNHRNHRKIIENPRKAASQFLNPVSINLKKLPPMSARRFMKKCKKLGQIQSAVSTCQFLLPGMAL